MRGGGGVDRRRAEAERTTLMTTIYSEEFYEYV